MKLPRDVSGQRLIQLLSRFGYQVTRQSGSHARLTTRQNGEHHLTIPSHPTLRIGTLNAILVEVARHFQREKDDIVRELFE